MDSARVGRKVLLAIAAVLAGAWLAVAAPAPDEDKEALRKQALKLNDVTGDDPIKGEIQSLVADAANTKKMLAVAATMAKEKDQPFNYNAIYILAATADKLKETATAEAFYRLGVAQALELKSGTKLAQTYGGLIDVLTKNKKYDECEKACKEFLGLQGDDTVNRLKLVVLRRLIQVFAKQGKFDDANKLVDNLLKAQPDNWLTLDMKGWVQREAGQYDEAAKTYEDVLDRITKDKDLSDDEKKDYGGEIRYSLSNVYLELNKIDKVTEQLEALMKQEPDNPTYFNDLGYIWADHDMNLDKAEDLIRKAIDLDKELRKKAKVKPEDDKDNSAYLDSLAWVLYKKKKYQEALPPLLEAVKDKEGQHIEIFDHLGDLYTALGEKAKAVEAWKKGVEAAGESKREQQRKTEVEKKIKANE
jgi:tetratricopeptide (TPR) repeat protein